MANNIIKKAILSLILASVSINVLVWFAISHRFPQSNQNNIKDTSDGNQNFLNIFQNGDLDDRMWSDSYSNNGSSMDNITSGLTIYSSTMNISRYILPSDIPEIKKHYTWPTFEASANVVIRSFTWISDFTDRKVCAPIRLGQMLVPLTVEDLQDPAVMPIFQLPHSGGVWSPNGCRPIDRVAILVPYRNREENLDIFVHHMHAFLQRQAIDYGLYIIHQNDARRFNRAKLFNIGFLLTQLMHNYTCYVLHDIDKLPEDSDYIYRCHFRPLHMPFSFRKADFNSTAVTPFNKSTAYYSARLYEGFFGGVSSLKTSHFLKINGLINSYWGWGAEDDELYFRLRIKKQNPVFCKDPAAKYVILYHKPDAVYSRRGAPNVKRVRRRMVRNGLNSVRFKLNSIQYNPLYTLIKVSL